MLKFRYLILIVLFGLFNTKVTPQNSIYSENFVVELISGKKIKLNNFKNKKLLIVNVASRCGFTRQYRDLQELQNNYADKLNILAVPCNQFGFQEPGSDNEILKFCKENYGVTFPMMSKISVKGSSMHPIYKFLTDKNRNGVVSSSVSWNFQKYLINEDGSIHKVISPRTKPEDPKIIEWINSI